MLSDIEFLTLFSLPYNDIQIFFNRLNCEKKEWQFEN